MLAINAFVFYLEVGLETPQKEQKLRGKFPKNTSFQLRAGIVKKDRNKAGMEKLKNTSLVRNDGALLSGLQRKALASLVHFVHAK